MSKAESKLSLPDAGDLNIRQQKFALNYVRTGNITQSAREAGYSENSAYAQGHALLKNPRVNSYVQSLWEEMAMPQVEAIARLGEMARGNIATRVKVAPGGDTVEYDSLGALKVLHGGDVQVNIQNNVLLEGW